MSSPAVFERYETKYLMSRLAYGSLMEEVRKHMYLDHYGHSLICNLYFDTPDYTLIRKSLDHPVYKEKLRIRSYGIAGKDSRVYIELKKKYDDIVYKRRVESSECSFRRALTDESLADSQILREIQYTYSKYPQLEPRVYLSYEREAWCPKDGGDFRVTFDENILYRTTNLSLITPPSGTSVIPRDSVLMELKCSGSIPLWMVQALSGVNVYKTSFSKYGMAYLDLKTKGALSYAAAI